VGRFAGTSNDFGSCLKNEIDDVLLTHGRVAMQLHILGDVFKLAELFSL
jgi:hypothetical protein